LKLEVYRILVSLHKDGKIDAVKLLTETVGNASRVVNDVNSSNVVRAEKAVECADIYNTVAELLYAMAGDETDEDEIAVVASPETIVI
jgi:hypothetical protein